MRLLFSSWRLQGIPGGFAAQLSTSCVIPDRGNILQGARRSVLLCTQSDLLKLKSAAVCRRVLSLLKALTITQWAWQIQRTRLSRIQALHQEAAEPFKIETCSHNYSSKYRVSKPLKWINNHKNAQWMPNRLDSADCKYGTWKHSGDPVHVRKHGFRGGLQVKLKHRGMQPLPPP